MSIEFLDDSTLWVSLSFIIFVCITLKPMLAQLSDSLEKKIDDLKKNIEESKQLKLEAEKLYKDQLEKQKDNINLIKRIKEDTNKESKRIKSQIIIPGITNAQDLLAKAAGIKNIVDPSLGVTLPVDSLSKPKKGKDEDLGDGINET